MDETPKPPILDASKQPKKQASRIDNLKGKGFKKGISGNPGGRPKGAVNAITLFEEALEKIAKEKNMSFQEAYVRRAYEKDEVMTSLAKKILPDLILKQGDDGNKQTQVIYVGISVDDKGKITGSLPTPVVSLINGKNGNGANGNSSR